MTDAASFPGFTYAVAVEIPEEPPVGCNSPLSRVPLRGSVSDLVCALLSCNFPLLLYYKNKSSFKCLITLQLSLSPCEFITKKPHALKAISKYLSQLPEIDSVYSSELFVCVCVCVCVGGGDSPPAAQRLSWLCLHIKSFSAQPSLPCFLPCFCQFGTFMCLQWWTLSLHQLSLRFWVTSMPPHD